MKDGTKIKRLPSGRWLYIYESRWFFGRVWTCFRYGNSELSNCSSFYHQRPRLADQREPVFTYLKACPSRRRAAILRALEYDSTHGRDDPNGIVHPDTIEELRAFIGEGAENE